jgi:hypothetical protein
LSSTSGVISIKVLSRFAMMRILALTPGPRLVNV